MVFAGFFISSARYVSVTVESTPPPEAVFVTGNFDVSGVTLMYQDQLVVIPTDIEFKTDGTKLFVAIQGSSSIYEYSMSNAWDLTTVSADATTSLSVSNVTQVNSIDFNRTGTKIYAGCAPGDIAEFSLGTPYDLSTAGSQTTGIYDTSVNVSTSNLLLESDGTTAGQVTRNNTGGTVSGTLTVASYFDATTDTINDTAVDTFVQLQYGYTILFNPTIGIYSVAITFKSVGDLTTASYYNAGHFIIGFDKNNNNSSIWVQPGENLSVALYHTTRIGGTYTKYAQSIDNVLNNQDWNTVVITRDPATLRTHKVYVNGLLVIDYTFTFTPDIPATCTQQYVRDLSGNPRLLLEIYKIELWDTELTKDQVYSYSDIISGSNNTLHISTVSPDGRMMCFSNSSSNNYITVGGNNTLTTYEINSDLTDVTVLGTSANVVPLITSVVAPDLHTTRTLEVSGGGTRFYQIYRNTDLSNVNVIEFKLGTPHDASTLTSATQIEDYFDLATQTGGTAPYDTFNSLKIKPDGSEMFLSGTYYYPTSTPQRTSLVASSGWALGITTFSRNFKYVLTDYLSHTHGNIKIYEYDETDDSFTEIHNIVGTSTNKYGYGFKEITNNGTRFFNGREDLKYFTINDYNGSSWSQTQKINLTSPNDVTFYSALSANEDMLFVTLKGYTSPVGRIGVYTESGGTWSQTQLIVNPYTSSDSNFSQLAVSADNTTLIAGDPFSNYNSTDNGVAWLFSNVAGTWTYSHRFDNPYSGADLRFGDRGLDINHDGTRVFIGSHFYNSETGAVHIFDYVGSSWSLSQTINGTGGTGTRFGLSVSCSSDGTRFIVGDWSNSTNGRAHIFDYVGSSWSLSQTLTHVYGSRRYGTYVGMAPDKTRLVVSETYTSSTGYIHYYTTPKNTQTYSLDIPTPVLYISGDQDNIYDILNGSSNVDVSGTSSSFSRLRSTDFIKSGTHSLEFVDTSSNVYVPASNITQLNSTNDYHTVSFWLHLSSFSGTFNVIFESSAYPSTGGYSIMIVNNYSLVVYSKTGSGSFFDHQVSPSYFNSSNMFNRWHHIVCVIPISKKSSENPYFYINGELQSMSFSTPWSSSIHPDNQGYYLTRYSGGNYIVGYMDEIKVFNTVLPEKTIKKIYLDGLAPARIQAFHLTFEDNTGADILPSGASLGGTSLATLQSNTVTYQGDYVGDFTSSSAVTTISNWTTFDHPFSVSFWMYYTGDTAATNKTIVGLAGWSGNGFRIRLNGTTLHFYYSGSSISTSVTGLVNYWHHVTISSDGTIHRLFLDGTLSASVSTAVSYTSGQTLYIGAETDTSPSEVFTGYLDDIRIYDCVLDPREVEYLYTSTIVHTDQSFYLSYDQSNVYDYHNETYNVSATGTGQYIQDPGSRVGTHSGHYPRGTTGTLVPIWYGLSSSNPLTFSLWAFPKTITGTHYLFSTETVSSGTKGIAARLENSGGSLKITILTYDSTFRTKYKTVSSVSTYINKWIHLAFVFTSTTGEIYINGSEQTLTTSGTWSYTINSGDGLRIGDIDDGTGTSAFDGAIDDFKVFSRGLNTEEISALYRAYTNSRIYDVVVGILPFATYFGTSGTYVPPTDGTITVHTDTTTQANFTFSGSTSGNDGTYDVSSTTLSSATLDSSFDNNNGSQLSFTGGGTLEIIFSIENETFKANQLRMETKIGSPIGRTPQNVVIYGGTNTQLYSGSTGFSYAGSTIQSGEEVSTVDFTNSTGYSSYKLAFSNPISGTEIKIADIKFRIV